MTLVLLIATLLSQAAAPSTPPRQPAKPAPAAACRRPIDDSASPGCRPRSAANAGDARSGGVLARRARRQDGRQHEEGARAVPEAGSGLAGRRGASHRLLHHRCGCRRAVRAVDSGRSRPAGHTVRARLHVGARSAGRALPLDACPAPAAQSGGGVQGGRTDPGAERRAADRARGEAGAEPRSARGSRKGTRRTPGGHHRTPRRAATQAAEHGSDASGRHRSPSARPRRR